MELFNSKQFLKFKFGTDNRIKIYKKLRQYSKQGISPYDALLKIKKRMEDSNNSQHLILNYWTLDMKKGKKFSDALKSWVPDNEINLIAAGEDSGSLHAGLDEAIKFASTFKTIIGLIIGSAIYPLILMLISVGFLLMFATQLAPAFIGLLPLDKWPWYASGLYSIAKFIQEYALYLLTIALIVVFIVKQTIGSWQSRIRAKIFDKFPPWGVYKVFTASAFLITLASLMKSGTPVNDAIKKTAKISSPWLRGYLDKMMFKLKQGGANFGEALDVGLFDDETAGDIIDYSDLGEFEKSIYAIGEDSVEKLVNGIKTQMKIVQNLMMLLVGTIVITIYISNYMLSVMISENAKF